MRRAKLYEVDGLTMTISQWSAYTGLSANTIRARIFEGWSFREAVKTRVNGVRRADIDECLHCTEPNCTGYCRKFPKPDADGRADA
jgi:hypothetical protein